MIPPPDIQSHELARKVLRLAVPIMLASLSQTLMSLIDIAMVGRLGAAAVAAVGLGGMLTYAFSSFLNAIQAGVQTVVARRVGEGRHSEAVAALRSTLYFALLTGSVFAGLYIWAARQLLPIINADQEVVVLSTAYVQLRGISLGPVMAGYVFYAFYNGISQPRIHLVVSVLANTLNVVLNYGLIFGRLGFPEMGAPGAGLATTLSTTTAFVLYALLTRTARIRHQYPGIWTWPHEMKTLIRILKLSLPISVQNFGVMIGFAVFMVLMGWVSTVALAATEIIINILSFSFMPAMGFLYATQTLVSENIGQGRHHLAEGATRVATLLCLILMGAMGILFILFPRPILHIFTPDEAIVTAGVLPLQILGLVQFFDAVGMVHHGALVGAGDNTFQAIGEMIIMWLLFLPATYVTSILMDWGITGGWVALAFYIVAYATMAYLRFRYGPWKRIVV
ncbi:MAG: MATE family efflux transporter [Fidelibacterota bacterium]|nr:MAG: MATE family efflux transporter [Candidatus Neomarinimicrobiota bacterium]